MTDDPSIPAVARRPRASLARVILSGAILGALLACTVEIGRMFLTQNRHEIVAGRIYRTGQLKPPELERFVRENNIKTVVNLRGRPASDWYPAESRTTQALGVSQEDVTLSANRLPPTDEIRRLIDVLDHSEYPIVMHCRQGADRTGLAAAIALMLHTNAEYAVARQQCSPRYGHMRVHTTASMDEFFDQYEDWLAKNSQSHSPDTFRHWATEEYSPGPGKARFEWLHAPSVVEVGKPLVFRMRAYNDSIETWNFKAGTRFGIHAAYTVTMEGTSYSFKDLAGFFDASVPPGGHMDLDIPLPPLPTAGKYSIFVDLAERNASFTQYGSEPLSHDWEARNPTTVRGK